MVTCAQAHRLQPFNPSADTSWMLVAVLQTSSPSVLRRACAVLVCVLASFAAMQQPAHGAETAFRSTSTVRLPAQAPDRAIPLAGRFDCDEGSDSAIGAKPAEQSGIIWHSPGPGGDSLWTDLSGASGVLTKSVQEVSLPGSGVPLVGDFDADGCSDVVFYGRGAKRDAIYWGGPSGLTKGKPLAIGGNYRPASGNLGGGGGADSILWFSPTGKELVWQGTGNRSKPFLTRSIRQQPGRNLTPVIFRDRASAAAQILWHAPGKPADSIWVLKGKRLKVARTIKLRLAPRFRMASCGDGVILHGPGKSADRVLFTAGGKRASFDDFSLDGTFKLSAAGTSAAGCTVAWSKRGAAQIWLSTQSAQAPAAAEKPSGPVISEGHPRIYLNAANKTRLNALITANDSAASRFKTMVDNELAGSDYYDYQAWYSAMLGELTGAAAYCTDAIARVDAFVTSEEALITAGLRAEVAGDSYLEVGPFIGNLSMTFDWCYDDLTASQRARWKTYANQAVWNVWHHEDAQWGGVAHPWSGWSVDNPSNNYYYSFLKATLLLGLATNGENDQASGWITKFRDEKIGGQLIPTFNSDLAGGGSREGTGYGVAMKGLFWLYDVWEASTGERIADLTPHTKASMAYLMHETVPTLDRIAPIGDHARDSTATLFDYHREYGLALAWLYRGDPLAAPLRTWLQANSVPQMSQGFEFVYDFMYRDAGAALTPLSSLTPTYFAPGNGDLFARSDWSQTATWVGFKMGPYTESHAHHDQLSFLLYKDQWLAYDGNVDAHSGIYQDEDPHNLVNIRKDGNLVRQYEGNTSDVLALSDNAEFTYAAADAAAVYGAASGMQLAQREIVFLKPDTLVVYDRVNVGSGGELSWQLNSPLQPVLAGSTATFGGANGLVARSVLPATATTSVVGLPSVDPDFTGGNRLQRTQTGGGAVYFLNVLSVDGAVSSVSDASAGADDGAAISFANGGTATVRFHRGAVGGSLTLGGAAGSFSGVLAGGVSAPAVFAP